jgi:hypothetical protein
MSVLLSLYSRKTSEVDSQGPHCDDARNVFLKKMKCLLKANGLRGMILLYSMLNIIRYTVALLAMAGLVDAGELIVLVPNGPGSKVYTGDKNSDDPFLEDCESGDMGMPVVQSFSQGDFDVDPKTEIIQNGQIIRYTYSEIKRGKYRVCLEGMEPIGCQSVFMETHVELQDQQQLTVFLFQPKARDVHLPDYISAVLKKHRNGMIELYATYEGSEKRFLQARSIPSSPIELASWIHYLRTDAVYSIKVLDIKRSDAGIVIAPVFEKVFRVGDGVGSNRGNR